MLLGAHVSIAGGLARAVDEARELRCEATQIFSGSKTQWRQRELGDDEVRAYRRGMRALGVERSMIHDSYLINLASPDPALLERSRAAFAAEMRRADRLGVPYLVFHPGAHKGDGEEAGIERVAESLNGLLREVPGRVTLLIENTAGQGTSLGHRLEHLAELLQRVRPRRRVGVCLDTCHLFAASYDLRTPRAYQATMRAVDDLVGIERVRAFHLNDSKGELGSRLDRHAEIGEGRIGTRAFGRLVRDERFDGVPGVLETPGGLAGFRRNLIKLRRLRSRRC
jgi:deoxyribonuclease-4